MTLPEAMQFARYPGIRRATWVHGLSMEWRDSSLKWCLSNWVQSLLHQTTKVDMAESQGLLNPESIAANDWEVAHESEI